VEKILYDGNGPAEAEVTDEYGVLHRLWRVSDPAAIRLLTTAMADKKLIIADGHHRYETALNYSKEHAPAVRRQSRAQPQPVAPAAYPEAAVMMTFVNMDSDGLVILPTHRVVHSLEGFDPGAFAQPPRSSSRSSAAEDDAPATWNSGSQQGTAFVAVTRNGAMLLRSKPEAVAAALAICPSASASST
jgi:hypothetical protein